MSHVVTLVTHTTNLTLDHLARVAAVLPGARDPVWLDEGTAADVPFAPPAGSDNRSWTGVARNALGDDPIDVVAQPARDRRKRLLIADMDSTMIAGECIDDLAAAAGVFDAVAAITMRSVRGLAPFEASLIERVRLLKGLSVADVSRVVGRVTPTAGAAVLDLWGVMMNEAGWKPGQPLAGSKRLPENSYLQKHFLDGTGFHHLEIVLETDLRRTTFHPVWLQDSLPRS